jgi:hypothetical protein
MPLVDVVVPCRSFGLDWWLDSCTHSLELEVASVTGDGVRLLVWLPGESADEYVQVATLEPTTARVERLSSVGDRTLLETSVRADRDLLPTVLSAVDATLVSGLGTTDGWYCRVEFPDESTLGRFERRCESIDIDPIVHVRWERATGRLPERTASGLGVDSR